MAIQTITATFASTATQAVSWTPLGVDYGINAGLILSDPGPVAIWLDGVTDGTANVNASAVFTGTVELTIYPKVS